MSNRGTVLTMLGFQLVTEACCKCGMVFAMDADYRKRRMDDHGTFHCPAGHPQSYRGRSEAEQLRDDLERQKQITEAAEARVARVRHERDQVAKAHSRMRRRVFNGVCPCCNRTFQNVMRHMKTEHSDQFDLRHVREVFGMTQAQVADEAGVASFQVSAYERGKPLRGFVRTAIEQWLERATVQEGS